MKCEGRCPFVNLRVAMKLDFCVACGERDSGVLEHHHLVPRSLGGSDEQDNLITLCFRCHNRAHGIERTHMRHLVIEAKRRNERLGIKNGGKVPFGYYVSVEDGVKYIREYEWRAKVVAEMKGLQRRRVSCAAIAEIIKDEFGISISPAGVWKVLKKEAENEKCEPATGVTDSEAPVCYGSKGARAGAG